MNKLLGAGLILWVGLAALDPATGSANAGGRYLNERHNVQPTPKWRRWNHGPGEQVTSVPELDPKSGVKAVTLLLGGLALAMQSRRRTAA